MPRPKHDSRRISLFIELLRSELEELTAWAFEEYRTPQEQASYIIAQVLKRRDLSAIPASTMSEGLPVPMTPNAIREARIARGLSQLALATLSGVGQRTICRLEAGHKCAPSTWLVVQAALHGPNSSA